MSVATPEPAAPAVVDLPPLRLLPVPECEPPYDDERAPEAWLTRRLPPPWDGPELPDPRTLVAGPALRAVPVDDDEDGPVRTALSGLPPARPFARALVQRVLEVRAGLRPVAQLQRDTSFELFGELEQRLVPRTRARGARPTARDVRSVHVQAREDGVAEGCATVLRGGRTVALAFRLEGVDGRWRCTALADV